MKAISQSTVLIVDDTETNIDILVDTLGDDYEVAVAMDGETALEIIAVDPPDLILLDIMMPGMDGYQVCEKLKSDRRTCRIPLIFITAMGEDRDQARGLALGAVDYITKPFNPELVRARVRNHLALKAYEDALEQRVEERTREVRRTQAVLIESLATLAEYRDPETGGHIKRTQNYVKALADHLKGHPDFCRELDDETIELLFLSAPLHDIGKVGVRDDILLKPGKLTDEEYAQIQKHTLYGYRALRETEQKLGESHFLRCARDMAHAHHEKWDGSGYPRGLKEREIPLAGRLMALADVYDALISRRVYRPPLPHEQAVRIIEEGKGSQFDPDVVEAFMALQETFRNIALTHADSDEERASLAAAEQTAGNPKSPIGTILLVEDNDINLAIMLSQLESLQYRVDTAMNGREALSKYRAGSYDLVLTDLDMPEMNGYELAAAIRRAEQSGDRPVPILAITSTDFGLTQERAHALGFNGYMLKPFETELLGKKLESLSCPDQP